VSGNREKGRDSSARDERFSVNEYLERIRPLAARVGFQMETFAAIGPYGLPVLVRGGDMEPLLYLSTGVHGDEPAGPLAIERALAADSFSYDFGWVIFPVLNPTGLEKGTRETEKGIDLNRDYRYLRAPESRAHRELLATRNWQFHAALGLHEDWEARGGYLYEHNREALPNPCQALLSVLEENVGIDASGEIDGWPTTSPGLIHPPSDSGLRDHWPEQIYLLKYHTQMSYTVETPSEFDLERRIAAHSEAIRVFGDERVWIEDRRKS
tara:strand:- start:10118 stop:10921 length:804 start_codon:yes stop_codon:yes gene_type:complete